MINKESSEAKGNTIEGSAVESAVEGQTVDLAHDHPLVEKVGSINSTIEGWYYDRYGRIASYTHDFFTQPKKYTIGMIPSVIAGDLIYRFISTSTQHANPVNHIPVGALSATAYLIISYGLGAIRNR